MSLTPSAPAVRARSRHQLHALLKDFDAVLASEYEALRHRDPERLQTAIQEKQRLASGIEALTPLLDIANAMPGDATEQPEWVAIRNLLGRCALANRTNGAAIDASRCFVTSMLDLMSGQRAGERTYTAAGRLNSHAPRLRFERV
jgi:flagellar biosynthesis/type III secretory pathway chaperone